MAGVKISDRDPMAERKSALIALRIDWRETDPKKVLGEAPDREKAQALIRLFGKLTTS